MRLARRRKKLGEILVGWNVIAANALADAVEYAQQNGKRIGEALIELELASEEYVTKALATQFDLEYVDLADYADRTTPMDVVLGSERTGRSQIVKQADVLMLLALLGDAHSREVWEANFDYYEPRCGHGSSLSPLIHALVAARLGRTELAERYFEQAAAIDLDNTMGNSAAGVHIAALGGLWQVAVLGFGGLHLGHDVLRFDPHLPASWRSLAFPLQWRRRRLRIELRQDAGTFSATLERGRPLTIQLGETRHRLRSGEVWVTSLGAPG